MQYSVQIQVRLGEQMCTFLEKEGFLESFVCSIDEASEDEFIGPEGFLPQRWTLCAQTSIYFCIFFLL